MPFDLQPVLNGDLVALRPLAAGDYDALYAVASDPDIWAQHPDRFRYEKERFDVFFREAMESRGALIATDAASGAVIGSSRFYGYDAANSEIEIGWTFLARAYWGGRYNGAMKRLMLRHAFRFVEHVVFLIGPDNVRSQRAVERIGGVRAGSRVNAAGRDSVMYRISAADWHDECSPRQRDDKASFNSRRKSMTAMRETAEKFFEACETGKGWAGCQQYCHPGATFAAQAGALENVKTLEAYTDWMMGLFTPVPDGSYEIKSFAIDEQRHHVTAFGVFRGTHTGPGGPVPPTGRRVEADYVYVMEFDDGKIRRMTKIWNDAISLKQLGWM